jgi:hypothetical protein
MKKRVTVLMIGLCFSLGAFSQSPRKCGCKTWRQWNSSIPKNEGESRWKRRQMYDVYLHQCIMDCRKKMIKGT